MSHHDEEVYSAGKPANPGGQGQGKGKKYGKNKVGVCIFNAGLGSYFYKELPLPAANNAISQGRGVTAADASVCDALNNALIPDESPDTEG
jgi:hypothetical protein